MKKYLMIGLLPLVSIMPQTLLAENTKLTQEASAIAKQFLGQLKPELKKGLTKGGPSHAIEVCHTKAPKIAFDLSQKTGWDINRVSLKPRGENASPDLWERTVLTSFNSKLASGADIKTLEQGAIIEVGGKKTFRYMKAIPTGKVCLKCHGTSLAKGTKETLQKLYPDDKATGFSLGQIRGAFSFKKEL